MDVYSGEQKQAGYVVLLWQYKMQLEVIQVPKFDPFLCDPFLYDCEWQ